MVTYRSIGGTLDFMLFVGPTPTEVTRQYTHYLGTRWADRTHLIKNYY